MHEPSWFFDHTVTHEMGDIDALNSMDAKNADSNETTTDDISIPQKNDNDSLSLRKKKKVLTFEEVLELPPPDYLIDGMFVKKSFITVYGKPKHGKSFFVFSIAYALATGRAVFGKKVNKSKVFYVAGEGQGGLGARYKALKQHYNDNGPIDIYTHMSAVNMTNETAVRELSSLIPEGTGLIIIDTLNRCSGGIDENSAQQMGLFVTGCQLLIELTGSAVLVVHHANKSETAKMRGSTVLDGALETLICVEKTGDRVIKVKNDWQKDCDPFHPMTLNLVASGPSCVLEMTDNKSDDSEEPKTRKLNNGDIPIVNAFKQVGEVGMTGEALKELLRIDNTTWQNARRRLCKNGWIMERDNLYFYTGSPFVKGVTFEEAV